MNNKLNRHAQKQVGNAGLTQMGHQDDQLSGKGKLFLLLLTKWELTTVLKPAVKILQDGSSLTPPSHIQTQQDAIHCEFNSRHTGAAKHYSRTETSLSSRT